MNVLVVGIIHNIKFNSLSHKKIVLKISILYEFLCKRAQTKKCFHYEYHYYGYVMRPRTMIFYSHNQRLL